MGEHIEHSRLDQLERQEYTAHLLNDIQALDLMIEKNMIESGITRIGAEQEMFLVNSDYFPAPLSVEVLESITDPRVTTELARYNLEVNASPYELKGSAFRDLLGELNDLLDLVQKSAQALGCTPVLSGILPTLSKREVDIDQLTPASRYALLNQQLRSTLGHDFVLKIRGLDELSLQHDSVLFEACNTSFQMHLQISPEDFIEKYNWAQAIAGPILSICCNSPLLMGRELWRETRIALFQQSLDTRQLTNALTQQSPRVGFGNHWERESITQLYKDDISAHRFLLTKKIEQDAMALIEEGILPDLEALKLFNGTVYRWNRPCYGQHNGTAHLRIENRYIPSGPTLEDEVANFALWAGVMMGQSQKYANIDQQMDFAVAKSNFIKAARYGKECEMVWNGQAIPARELLREEFLPLAERGLSKMGVDCNDIAHYLGIIADRLSGLSGAQWQLRNFRKLKKHHHLGVSLQSLCKAMINNQKTSLPVHQWPDLSMEKDELIEPKWVGHIMTSRLYKVKELDVLSLAKAIMEWNDIHHLPVEDRQGRLSGLLSWNLLEALPPDIPLNQTSVADVMVRELITVRPETPIEEAISLLKKNQIGCLPVCRNQQIVGILSQRDL